MVVLDVPVVHRSSAHRVLLPVGVRDEGQGCFRESRSCWCTERWPRPLRPLSSAGSQREDGKRPGSGASSGPVAGRVVGQDVRRYRAEGRRWWSVAATEFRLMATMELRIDDAPVKLPGAAERGLLAVLLLSPGRTVAASALIDRLWSESTLPADPLNALQLRVSKLRRALAAHGLDVIQRVAIRVSRRRRPEHGRSAPVCLARRRGAGAVAFRRGRCGARHVRRGAAPVAR